MEGCCLLRWVGRPVFASPVLSTFRDFSSKFGRAKYEMSIFGKIIIIRISCNNNEKVPLCILTPELLWATLHVFPLSVLREPEKWGGCPIEIIR
ncbi:hypothetical protein F4861DRAFT_311643 [Xylaria intraflava]|nr:hypothetical protein F4861DRAFT_311643 [Xylaria intraflava]